MTNLQTIFQQVPWVLIGSALVTLAPLCLGWYLNELSNRRKTSRVSAGPPLTTLLLIRRRMIVARKMKEALSSKVELATNAEIGLNEVMRLLLPELDLSDGEYNQAVWWIAGIDPLLAMWLKLDRSRHGQSINTLSAMAALEGAPAGLHEALSEIAEPENLDDSILALARLHGRKTVRKIQRHLTEEEDSISENLPRVDQMLQSIFPNPKL